MAVLNKAYGSRWPARMKETGDVVDSLKIQLGIRPRNWREQITRHKKVGRIVIGNVFGRHTVLRAGFLNSADERPAFVVSPVADLVCKRKSLAPVRTILTDRDDSSVVASDDPCLATIKFAEPNTGAQMKRYSLKIDLFRLGDPQFLK